MLDKIDNILLSEELCRAFRNARKEFDDNTDRILSEPNEILLDALESKDVRR